jgi:hypothetical protein
MNQERKGRINSVVHGDLNPRNVLVVDEQPCLIDYALTKSDRPLFCDFVRLEGCLMMEVLPDDLSWRQLLRLQRWLALACRLAGERAADADVQLTVDRLAGLLAADLASLGRRLRAWRLKTNDPGGDALQLVAEHPAVVLLGDAGAGKSTLAREWEYRLAQAIRGTGDAPEPRLPVVVRASEIAAHLPAPPSPKQPIEWTRQMAASVLEQSHGLLREPTLDSGAIHEDGRSFADLCEAGAVAVIVDALNELADADKQRVAEWIVAFREACPLTPMLVCHRQYNYPADLLPYLVVTLQKVEQRQAERYIRDYLRAQRQEDQEADVSPEDLAEQLIKLLLKSPDHQQVRDLAQTPLFLWMIVERYNKTRDLPPNRARLFDDFSRWYLTERHHEEHGEAVAARFDYDTKAALLGRLGYELVQRRATDLPEADAPLNDDEDAVLEEIVTAETIDRWFETFRGTAQAVRC